MDNGVWTAWAALKRKQRRRRELEEAHAHPRALGPGGRVEALSYRKLRKRYPNLEGKATRMLQPERTQWYLNYIENKAKAADP
jgi:hypothetical protein